MWLACSSGVPAGQNPLGTERHLHLFEHRGKLKDEVKPARISNGLEALEPAEEFTPTRLLAADHLGAKHNERAAFGGRLFAKQVGRLHSQLPRGRTNPVQALAVISEFLAKHRTDFRFHLRFSARRSQSQLSIRRPSTRANSSRFRVASTARA